MSVSNLNSLSLSDHTIVEAVRAKRFATLSDEDALRFLESKFSSELERLKRAEGTIEGSGGKKTIGHLTDGDRSGLTPSQLLYHEDYEEPNRTLVSFLALKWTMAGDYESFTRNQPQINGVKLREESFNGLVDLARDILKDPETLLALIVAIVVGDVGKDSNLLDEVRKVDKRLINDENHDEIVYTAAKNDMLPALNLLSNDLKEDVIKGLHVGSKLNIPQLAQAENVPANLESIKYLRGPNKRAFNLKYLEVLFDVAGSGGQVDARGAQRMIEPVYQGYVTSRKALLDLLENKINFRQAYDSVLIKRAQIIKDKGFHRSLSVENKSERALLRIMTMGRAATNDEASLFEAAFNSLDGKTRANLVAGLNVDGIKDGGAILPYYMPAILAESVKNVTKTNPPTSPPQARRSERLHKKTVEKSPEKSPEHILFEKKVDVVASCLRFLTRVYGEPKVEPFGTMGHVVERNLSFADKTVKSSEFAKNPKILDDLPLPWEKAVGDAKPKK